MKSFSPISATGLRISSFRRELLTDRYANWLNDPEVVRYSEQRHAKHTIDSCIQYWERAIASDNLFLSMELLDDTPCHIGNISVDVDIPNLSADISIMIGDKHAWGRGYASKAWVAVMNYLLNDIGFRRVTAGTMEVNHSMIRLIERTGMKVDCVRKRHFLWENQEVALVSASRFR